MNFEAWFDRYSGKPISQPVQHVLDTEDASAGQLKDVHNSIRFLVPTEMIQHLVELAPQGHGGVPEALKVAFGKFADTYEAGTRDQASKMWAKEVAKAIGTHGGFLDDASAGLFVDTSTVELHDGVRTPDVGSRVDDAGLLYSATVNMLYGAPESGKSLVATALAVQTINSGGSVLWVDIDHNGATATLSRFVSFGADLDDLKNPSKFLLAEPQNKDAMLRVVSYAQWKAPTLVVVDSLGELLGLFGVKSDSEYDYTPVNAVTLAPMARAGSAVLAIDHVTKSDSDKSGYAAGSHRKKAATDGVSLRVKLASTFIPGHGGSARLLISKDRPGGLRALCAATSDAKEQVAAVFTLGAESNDWTFELDDSTGSKTTTVSKANDLETLRALDPAPQSVRDIRTRVGWGTDRAGRVWREYKANPVPGSVPGTDVPGT